MLYKTFHVHAEYPDIIYMIFMYFFIKAPLAAKAEIFKNPQPIHCVRFGLVIKEMSKEPRLVLWFRMYGHLKPKTETPPYGQIFQ